MTSIRVYTLGVIPLIQLGIQAALQGMPGIVFPGDIRDIRTVDETKPSRDVHHVVFVDMDEELLTKLETEMRDLKTRYPGLRVLFLLPSALPDDSIVRVLRLGGDGYLSRSTTPDNLLSAVRSAVEGNGFLEPQVAPFVLAELRKPSVTPRTSDPHADLTSREQLLVQLAADGLGNTEIADTLGLAEKTVRNLWSSLFEKTGMNDRTQTVLWAIRTGQAELR